MAMASPTREHLAIDPDDRRASVLSFIRGASRTLCVTVFRCDDVEIARALAAARRRGVDVRVLITNRARGSKWELRALRKYLIRQDVTVTSYDGPLSHYHAKYAVADEARALIGSLNYTSECFSTTTDFLVMTADTEVVSTLSRLFAHDTTTPWDAFECAEASPRLIIGPHGSRERWAALLGSSRSSVLIADRKLSDPALEEVLDSQRRRGVDVARAARRTSEGLRLHGKAVVVDDRLAIVGSQSLSRKSLDLRRELSLILSDPRHVQALTRHIAALARQPVGVGLSRLRSERAA